MSPSRRLRRPARSTPGSCEQIEGLVAAEAEVRRAACRTTAPAGLLGLKKLGFQRQLRLAELAGCRRRPRSPARHAAGRAPVFKRIDTCAGEFPSDHALHVRLLRGAHGGRPERRRLRGRAQRRDKVIILGGGPNRIGQGIEFDYCCVHAAYALKEAGIETIMVNCNPETVSTDYDTSDRLYFEPLTAEDVIEIARVEQSPARLEGRDRAVRRADAAQARARPGGGRDPILGTSPDAIDLAEDRERFQELLGELGLKQPANGTARRRPRPMAVAERIGYPVLIRPSYVLGGRAMEIVHDADQLDALHRPARSSVSGTQPRC